MAEPTKPPAKPVAKAPMAATPWVSEFTQRLAAQFGEQIQEFASYLGQNFAVVRPDAVVPLLDYLKRREEFDYLVDVTATDTPERAERFELIYILYSFARNERLRLKTRLPADFHPLSATPVHKTANWLEREVFDLFGIEFANHPDMRRILMPDDWRGYPLRKDYALRDMDQRWVQENAGIESGQ
jgi:NADH-quinone oxidoreductase subunit C